MVGPKRRRASGSRPRAKPRASAPRRLTTRVLPGTSVLLVVPHGALKSSDFERLGKTVDARTRGRARLDGVVVHAEKFPGWKDFDAFVDHLRFVRDHHDKVSRIAIATDAAFARWVARFAGPFVAAQIKAFPYDAADDAIAWVGGR